jgi:tetrahedral aminopeptidase
MNELLEQLTAVWGPSGHETAVRALLQDLLRDHVDELRVDPLGNLVTLKRAAQLGAPRVMLAAHMDEIGVMVTHVDHAGFLRFAPVGGVLMGNLIGTRVEFEDGSVGVIGVEKRDDPAKAPKNDELFIDVGARSKAEVTRRVGDAASFRHTLDFAGERAVAPNMDDRIGCLVLVETLRRLERGPNDVYGVFTVQEEVGLRGATTSAFGVRPDVAIALDVTLTGDTPEARTMAVALGQGPAIKVKDSGMIAHRGVRALLERCAAAAGVTVQLEVLVGGSTDAAAIQTSAAGVPAGCLSIPSRYVHTPSQMVDLGDVAGAVQLLAYLLQQPIRDASELAPAAT